ANIEETVAAGSREVVITGVNLSRYSDGTTGFSSLLERILELPGDFRLRISSMEPDSLDDRFLDILSHPKMCPHLHLCLQSGSERILLQMRRQYSYLGYRKIVDAIRTRLPDFNLTTDVIVGFPGETEADFADTENACREIGFSHVHTFPYSRRSGTRADRMDGQISEDAKKERSARIRRISDENKRNYRLRFVGREQRVLVERKGARKATGSGYGEHYVPVEFHLPEVRYNEFYRVRLTALGEGDDPALVGSPIPVR
ncbi:MAG TPA: radical SAM protein, partial [Spirochaetia bacterium]|nr:radical SAM protein [Spirochaetia bacterium]